MKSILQNPCLVLLFLPSACFFSYAAFACPSVKVSCTCTLLAESTSSEEEQQNINIRSKHRILGNGNPFGVTGARKGITNQTRFKDQIHDGNNN
ncbi:hypothetical protein QBC38DRAFT_488255 [Podospora fimiseda]|uniref:Secreted protein n=1 Tax=Podospora fimiseda TaxID=252190 RepID=A0AAN7GS08_9PEZI|nr:hypothetical protein QBC38DRAFT_488255 [Podospora fimiseda]